jgi:hypothetical protein
MRPCNELCLEVRLFVYGNDKFIVESLKETPVPNARDRRPAHSQTDRPADRKGADGHA